MGTLAGIFQTSASSVRGLSHSHSCRASVLWTVQTGYCDTSGECVIDMSVSAIVLVGIQMSACYIMKESVVKL